MTNILIGIIGEDKDAGEILIKSFKKFTPDKIVLLVKEKNIKNVDKVIKKIEKIDIDYETHSVSNFLKLEEVFVKIKEISQIYKKDSLVIAVDTDYMSSCLALSSAFVNGIAAIGVLKDEIISYPIMKFSYSNALNDTKLKLLNILNKNGKINSMEKLAKLAKMSLPLIAYHLRGNRDSSGLEELNLIQTERENGLISVELTELGKLIVSGNVDFNCKTKDCM